MDCENDVYRKKKKKENLDPKKKKRKVTLWFREHSAIIYFHNLKNHHIPHLENSDSVANNTVFEKCKVTIQILNRKRIN